METEGFQAAVEFALRSKESSEGFLWARRIVDVLEQNTSGGAIKWGIAVTAEECGENRCDQCIEWLQQLAQMVSVPENADATRCEIAAQDIWYFEPPTDNIQRAVSRLYFAWNRFLTRGKASYLFEVSRAMTVFSYEPSESGKIQKERFTRAIDTARRMLQDST